MKRSSIDLSYGFGCLMEHIGRRQAEGNEAVKQTVSCDPEWQIWLWGSMSGSLPIKELHTHMEANRMTLSTGEEHLTP